MLSDLGVSRVKKMSQKEKILYKRIRVVTKSMATLRKRSNIFKLRAKPSKSQQLDNVLETLPSTVANFVRSQIRLSNKNPKGRRFTLQDKVLALVLQKQSGRAYRMFRKIFAMPSRKTTNELLNRIPINAGINKTIFNNLKLNVDKMKAHEKLCTVVFDEMALEPNICINTQKNQLDGFEDFGDQTSSSISDHVQVFMLRGVTKKWKQPVAYTFCKSTTNTITLVRNIKTVIRECQKIGLTVVASVSDQGSTNQAAINYLVNTSVPTGENRDRDLKSYNCGGCNIVHIYDAPHLIKGVRNNLLNKTLVWENDGETVRANWSDIVTVYEMDNTSGNMRSMPKLTEAHVHPTNKNKMRVSYAVQIFSHSVASLMFILSRTGRSALNTSATKTTITNTLSYFRFNCKWENFEINWE